MDLVIGRRGASRLSGCRAERKCDWRRISALDGCSGRAAVAAGLFFSWSAGLTARLAWPGLPVFACGVASSGCGTRPADPTHGPLVPAHTAERTSMVGRGSDQTPAPRSLFPWHKHQPPFDCLQRRTELLEAVRLAGKQKRETACADARNMTTRSGTRCGTL